MQKVKMINSDVYCIKCGKYLGMTCDPFIGECEKCFPKDLLTK